MKKAIVLCVGIMLITGCSMMSQTDREHTEDVLETIEIIRTIDGALEAGK